MAVTPQNLTIATFSSSDKAIEIFAPTLALYTTGSKDPSTQTKVVKTLSITSIYATEDTSVDPKIIPPGVYYQQVIFSFELLSALLDSAPSGQNTPTLFFVQINLPTQSNPDFYKGKEYILDAQIQTKGNSAMSPTYRTQPYLVSDANYAISFPVTNFFNVSAPGAPYTLTMTITLIK